MRGGTVYERKEGYVNTLRNLPKYAKYTDIAAIGGDND